MDVSLNLWTDGAMLCIFDPFLFEETKPAEVWPFHRNPAVRDGKFVLVGLQGDCGFPFVSQMPDSPSEKTTW